MKRFRLLGAVVAVGLVVTAMADTALARANIMFILDVSGSMAARLDGKRKIVLAKAAFNDMIGGLLGNTHAGLYVYGHHGDRDCAAHELKIPPAKLDAAAMTKAVSELQALKGATPLTAALAKSMEAIGNYKNPGQRTVVLLSDGKENCGGDPVAFAQEASSKLGGLIKIFVVGFDVKEEERKQLEAVAKAGSGAYYDAANAKQLASALNTIARQVVKTSIFEDSFDAKFLDAAWDVSGDSPDGRTLADGNFVVVTEAGTLAKNTAKNVLLYKDKIAEKNYDVVAALDADYQAYGGVYGDAANVRTQAGIVLHESKDNYVTLHLANIRGGYAKETGPYAIFTRRSKGKEAKPLRVQLRQNAPLGVTSAQLKIEKRGFKYTGFASLDGKKWTKIGAHALFGKTLRLGIYALRGSKATEAIAEFDRFEILRIEK